MTPLLFLTPPLIMPHFYRPKIKLTPSSIWCPEFWRRGGGGGGVFIRLIEADTEVRLEIKYDVIISSYFLICVKNTMEIFYKFLFYVLLFLNSSCSSSTFFIRMLALKPLRGSRNHRKWWVKSQWRRGFYWCRGFWRWGHVCRLTV